MHVTMYVFFGLHSLVLELVTLSVTGVSSSTVTLLVLRENILSTEGFISNQQHLQLLDVGTRNFQKPLGSMWSIYLLLNNPCWCQIWVLDLLHTLVVILLGSDSHLILTYQCDWCQMILLIFWPFEGSHKAIKKQ